MNKSLLMLLQEEDELVKKFEYFNDAYHDFSKLSENIANDFAKRKEETEKNLVSCRKELSQYLNQLLEK